MEVFKVSAQQTKDNLKELSRTAVSNTKTLHQTAREYLISIKRIRSKSPHTNRSSKKTITLEFL
jgi:hypothetical protein